MSKRAVIIGTGPSVTDKQLALVELSDLPVYGVNNVIFSYSGLNVFTACNIEWWNYYGNDWRVKASPADKWTWDQATAEKYGVKHIKGRWADSFSTDPGFIHYGHSAGYQILNLAYHYGVREFVLIGYDMRYKEGYQRDKKIPGQGRHYFGEYPKPLQHWPKVGQNGEFTGLLNVYRKINTRALGIRIINCSPGTALDFFETAELSEVL
jgi:hypothetical protein